MQTKCIAENWRIWTIIPYLRKQELVYLAYDDIADCGKGVWTQ